MTVRDLSAYYGEARALYNISFTLQAGTVLSIIGANGAGKTTLLKAIVGLTQRGAAARSSGEITYQGQRLDRMTTEQIVDCGITMVPEGRRLFVRMSVEDNLIAGAYLPRCRANLPDKLLEIYSLFPQLGERRSQIVAQMSGGEQQMVAIGRALMSSPRLILMDELSLGLAPAVVEDIYRKVMQIHTQGVALIIVEQDMKRALSVADQAMVMLEGNIVLAGKPAELSEDIISAAYFGTSGIKVLHD